MTKHLRELQEKNPTAFYTFDMAVLKERIRTLKAKMPDNASLCYAVKANPFVIGEVEEDFEHFEICSPGEALICEKLNVPKNKMVISGVYKTPEFIESLVADLGFNGVFTVESMTQYQLLSELSRKYEKPLRFLLRLTNGSQFGMNEADIESILKTINNHPMLNCEGIQFFSGTQKTSVKKLRRELNKLDRFLIHLKEDLHFIAGCLEYGPGFPIIYFEDEGFVEDTYLREFAQLLYEMTFQTKIILELGRSIVAGCGKYYTHIVDIKNNQGQNYALVDGGMHHIVYYGQVMAMKQPKLSVLGKPDVIPDTTWTVCGSLCSMNDIIVKQIALPEIEIGDLICFENTGAYCMTEGMALFLSRDIPPVYLIPENGEPLCVRERFETSALNLPKYERKA